MVLGMGKNESLLLVDDDTLNLMQMYDIFRADYTVCAVKDGESALEKAKLGKPDLILLDINMPGMNGFDVLAELKSKEDTKEIPVIMITGAHDADAEEKGLGLGAADFLRKPFNPAVVKHRVRNQIEVSHMRKELAKGMALA